MSEFRSDQGGAALIEAALVLPILLLLVLGVLDISLLFWTSGLAEKAVQLGARQAIVSSPVAVGPGLDRAESQHYWDGLPPGASCAPSAEGRSPCPDFAVTCDVATGCRCRGSTCGFRLAAGRLTPILKAMQAVMPEIRPENLEIAYTTNGFGYVARPGPVPVDVRVTLVGMHYRPLFLDNLLGTSLPLHASAQLSSEALVTR